MKKLIFAIIFLFACNSLNAQYLASDSLARPINTRALMLISNFEEVLQFDNSTKIKAFKNYFHLPTSKIFNDVMPDNKLDEKVTPEQYIELIKKFYADTGFVQVALDVYDVGSITIEDEYAMLSLLAKKYVSSITKNNINYTDTFNLKIDIIYQFKTSECKIYDVSSIEKREKYIQIFPQYRGFMNKVNMPDDTILISGVIFPTNKEGYILLKNINSSNEFLFQGYRKPVFYSTYKVPDHITIFKNKLDPIDKNIVKINFWKWMVYADFRNHVIFNGESPIKLSSDTFGINILNNGSFSNFVLMNLTRRVNEKGYWSIKFGAGVDVFSYTSYLKNNTSTYPAIDPDGDPYLRINNVYNLKEKHNLTYLSTPFIIEKGFTFGKNSFFVNAAYYFMLNYSATYNLDADAIYAGYYDYLFGLTIQENGVYDFGAYHFEIRNLPLIVDPFLMAYGYGFGVNRQLTRKMYIDVAFNYRKSINYLFLENKINLSDNFNLINNLNNLNHQFEIKYMNLSVGLSVKL